VLLDRCLSCFVLSSVCLPVTLVYCGQTVGCIKMSLGKEVGLGPGDIVLDGDPDPPKGGTAASTFRHMYYGQTTGWTTIPLSTEIGCGPRHIVLDGDPASPKGPVSAAPNFRPVSVVTKELDGSRCHLVGRYRPRPR